MFVSSCRTTEYTAAHPAVYLATQWPPKTAKSRAVSISQANSVKALLSTKGRRFSGISRYQPAAYSDCPHYTVYLDISPQYISISLLSAIPRAVCTGVHPRNTTILVACQSGRDARAPRKDNRQLQTALKPIHATEHPAAPMVQHVDTGPQLPHSLGLSLPRIGRQVFTEGDP
jgi:hypothetical protein